MEEASPTSMERKDTGLKVISLSGIRPSIYEPIDEDCVEDVKEILHDLRSKGEAALLKHAVRLNDLDSMESSYRISMNEMEKAYYSLDSETKDMFQRIAERIERFARAQKNAIQEMEIEVPGGKAGHNISPLNVAGCYAPGGRYPLPSSVFMTAITARVAGVQTVVVASPRPSIATLAAAYIAKADIFLAIGGAQAIAAMAYGIGNIPECDIIVGPGNKWVTAAKSLISGKCAIDMLAGPSECLVIADDTSSPKIIASDLLAQAEHDIAAIPILVTTSRNLISRVNEELCLQLKTLTTADVASHSLQNGFAILCNTMEECISASDKIGPEHLEIMTHNSEEISKLVKCYGALFIGKNSAEVFGDYGIGPNHVLPTGTTSRYTGGLSVYTFLRIRSWMRIDTPTASIIKDTAAFARIEGLEGHARAAEARMNL